MKVRFLLSEELILGVKRGKITARDLVKHLLSFDNVETLITEIDNTSLSDLYVDGCKVVAGAIDNWTGEIELKLNEKYKIVENVKTCSACRIENNKVNKDYTVCLDNEDNVYLTNRTYYDNNGNMAKGILISRNSKIDSLLTSAYCELAIEYLFNTETLKEYEKIKKDFNITITPSEDPEYIASIKKYIKKGLLTKAS